MLTTGAGDPPGITRADLAEVLEGRPLLIASNRGPVAFEQDSSGELAARRGAGGLVTALTHVMRATPGLWVASAMSRGDREMVRRTGNEHLTVPGGAGDLSLRYLLFDRTTYDRYYNRIANWVFWFMQHAMWNLPIHPRFDLSTREAWGSYHEVNRRFADAIAEEVEGSRGEATVMLHDYHLMLAARYLREKVPDAFSYHFTHSPWCSPDLMRVLPGTMAEETLEGMLANDLLGFQTVRWASNFLACCREILDARVDAESATIFHKGRVTAVRHYPISIDVESVRRVAASPEAAAHRAWLERTVGDRHLVLRVDRLELSKNVVRGLRAFEEFLRLHPEWRGRVVHVALVYPSRRALWEYRSYEAEVLDTQDRINTELGTDDWQPIVLVNEDNYARAVSCLSRYDVLLVNPIFDGMNLVAKEGPAVNESEGVLILSRNAGAWHELGHAAVGINPFDLTDMAEALHAGLTMEREQRRAWAGILRDVVERNDPTKWVWHQLDDIRKVRGR